MRPGPVFSWERGPWPTPQVVGPPATGPSIPPVNTTPVEPRSTPTPITANAGNVPSWLAAVGPEMLDQILAPPEVPQAPAAPGLLMPSAPADAYAPPPITGILGKHFGSVL